MQAVQKKPNFKCPKFSVPAKPQREKSKCTENQGKKKILDAQKHLPEKIRSDNKVSNTEQTLEQASQSGDNKIENAEVKGTSIKTEDIQESGDNVKTNLSKEQNVEDKQDDQEGDNIKSEQTSTIITDKKVVEKKNKTKFSVKGALDNQRDAGNKNTDKSKKKKENNSDVNKQKKDKEKKEQVEKKDPKEKKNLKTKEPKIILPVRSLTDEEYTAIFDAAIENAMNLNFDEWAPKATSPVKKKEPVKKKYSVTVGKKAKEVAKSTQESCPRPSEEIVENNEEDDEHEVIIGLDNSEVGDVAEDAQVEDVEKQKTEDTDSKEENSCEKDGTNNLRIEGSCDEGADSNQENNEIAGKMTAGDDEKGENADDRKLVDENNNDLEENGERSDAEEEEEIVVDEIEEEPAEERAQDVNETTPVGSEADLEERHSKCIITPIKKKKIPNVNKNPKLEPKQLPFEKPKEVSMVEKVKQLKKQKLEKQNLPAKKRKLSHDIKKHVVEKADIKAAALLEKDGKRKKPSEKKVSKKQKLQEREVEINGTWVQCCNSTCMKWRYLSDVSDPTLIPERWTCSMNTNKKYDSCEKAEEVYDESEHIYTKFAEGSVVWAKMTGYPWWPAMVEIDPDSETFFSTDLDDSMIPTHYHVVFFDDNVSRTWVKSDNVKMFTGNEEDDDILYQIPKKGQAYKKEIAVAKKNAMRAKSCTIQERIELFGFAARYKGPWSSKSKASKKDKGKSLKVTSGHKIKAQQVTSLDEDTMDDVIENTEALLDNVEEMLDSINSQLDDSDADSDFMPEELIVVETKKKKARKSLVSGPSKIEDSSKKKVNFADADVEIDGGISKISTEYDKEQKDTEENFIIKAIKDTKLKTVTQSLKLDSDIFTMEMSSLNDDASVNNDDNKNVEAAGEGKTDKAKDEKITGESRATSTKITGKSAKRKKIDDLNCSQFKVKAKKQKDIKIGELDSRRKDSSSEEKLDEEDKCSKQDCMQNDLPKTEYSTRDIDNKNSDTPRAVTVKNSDAAKNNKTSQEKTGEITCSGEGKNDFEETDKNKEIKISSQKEKGSQSEINEALENDNKAQDNIDFTSTPGPEDHIGIQEFDELDDEIDLDAIERDAVPGLDREATHSDNRRSMDQNLDNESDSDFDLEEHYMYETVTDGSDKVRERGVINVPAHITEVDEDSDPFDLMEE